MPLESEPVESLLLNQNEGQEPIKAYLSQTEGLTQEDMLEKLKPCNSNHFWTLEEKQCLVYFMDQCNQDFAEVHQKYFQHRSEGALKNRYGLIVRGEDTPMNTPRLSIGAVKNGAKELGNEILKALTPRKPQLSTLREEDTDPMDDLFPAEEDNDEKPAENAEEITAEETDEFDWALIDWLILGIGIPFVLCWMFALLLVVLPETTFGPELLVYRWQVNQVLFDTKMWFSSLFKKFTQ